MTDSSPSDEALREEREFRLQAYYRQEIGDRAARGLDPQRAARRADLIVRLSDREPVAFLEVGCGAGTDGVVLNARPGSYVGVDLTTASVEHCRGLGLTAQRASVLDLPSTTTPSTCPMTALGCGTSTGPAERAGGADQRLVDLLVGTSPGKTNQTVCCGKLTWNTSALRRSADVTTGPTVPHPRQPVRAAMSSAGPSALARSQSRTPTTRPSHQDTLLPARFPWLSTGATSDGAARAPATFLASPRTSGVGAGWRPADRSAASSARTTHASSASWGGRSNSRTASPHVAGRPILPSRVRE